MSRKKSPVVLPQPDTSVLRRSARIISRKNRDGQGKPTKDLGFDRKIRGEIGPEASPKSSIEGLCSKKFSGWNDSMDGFPSVRRSLRISNRGFSDAGKEKSPRFSSTTNVSCSFTPRRSSRISSGGGSVYRLQSSSIGGKSGNCVLSRCSTKSVSSEKGNCGGDGVISRDRSRSLPRPKTKQMFRDSDDEEEKEVGVSLSKGKGNGVRPRDRSRSRPRSKTKQMLRDSDEEEEEVGGSLSKVKGNGVRSRDKSRSHPRSKTKQMLRDSDEEEEVGGSLSKVKGNGVRSRDKSRSHPRSKTKQMLRDSDDEEEEAGVCLSKGKGNGVRPRDRSRTRPRPKTKQMFRDSDEEEEVGVSLSKVKGNGVRPRDRSRSRPRPQTKQMPRDCDDDEEEVSLCLSEGKRMRIAKINEEEKAVPKADEGKRIEKEEERLKTKNERGWTEELELALQGAYLTVKPSPNFWKKVSKMVPGKSAQECFDKVNADLITPRQPQPRSRARKSNLSPIPQFSLSASKLLKPNSPKTKIRQRKGNLSKKAIRHLLEKQNHMDQDLGFDLFSVLEPGATSNFLSTPTEKGKSLPRILESQVPGSSKDQTNLVSPPVLKQVKNKALHEKYIDHLHMREAKRKAEYNRLVGKENVRPIDNQKNDLVKAAKDALFFNVQDAVQKLKSLETENSSSSSEFCYGRGETDEEDESI